jgi:hypothetical protein
MSDTDSKPLVPIWTPDDFQRTRDDAEFEADMDYLRSLADAIFEHASPADLLKFADGAS